MHFSSIRYRAPAPENEPSREIGLAYFDVFFDRRKPLTNKNLNSVHNGNDLLSTLQ
jgi:hypothetical protein